MPESGRGAGWGVMGDRSGIFAGDDPVALLRDWLREASRTEPSDPNAMSLATLGADGLPNVRIVLLKEIAADGLVFYTNYGSVKGGELDAGGGAAIALHWKSVRRQVRARGPVDRVAPDRSDAYYDSRPLDSRLGAWASRQSRPLENRQILEDELEAARRTHGDRPPRPEHWGGYRLRPVEVEFWAEGAHRLHDRFRWSRSSVTGIDWQVCRLYP